MLIVLCSSYSSRFAGCQGGGGAAASLRCIFEGGIRGGVGSGCDAVHKSKNEFPNFVVLFLVLVQKLVELRFNFCLHLHLRCFLSFPTYPPPAPDAVTVLSS